MKNFKWNVSTCWTLFVVACILIFVGCAGIQAPSKPAAVPEISPGLLKGYLPFNALPNSLALIPQPPTTGSTALALDEEIFRKTRTFRGTPRWELATQDAELKFPQAAGTFSCAINAPITEKDTPRLYILMRRTLMDAGLSTYAAKSKYKRPRPFVVNKETSCTPDEEKN